MSTLINPSLGSDMSCVNDLDPSLSEVSGRTTLAQAIVRRLITPRGMLLDDPNYGFDLTGFVNDDVGAADIARIQSGIEAECLKDERVLSAIVATSFLSGVLTVSVSLVDNVGPFNLTLAVTSVTATILQVSQ